MPLIDHRVVEFSWRLPRSRQAPRRHEQVAAAAGARPPRSATPGRAAEDGLRHPARRMAARPAARLGGDAARRNSACAKAGLLDAAGVRRSWEEHLSGHRNWQYLLWDVLMLEAWRERWARSKFHDRPPNKVLLFIRSLQSAARNARRSNWPRHRETRPPRRGGGALSRRAFGAGGRPWAYDLGRSGKAGRWDHGSLGRLGGFFPPCGPSSSNVGSTANLLSGRWSVARQVLGVRGTDMEPGDTTRGRAEYRLKCGCRAGRVPSSRIRMLAGICARRGVPADPVTVVAPGSTPNDAIRPDAGRAFRASLGIRSPPS